jgi:hypothetical protein
LAAIARESAKERNRETTGIGVDNFTPPYPDVCVEPWENSSVLLEAVG